MPSSHLILCRPLFLLPPITPSIRVFSSESTLCWGGQSTGVSASASFLPMNTQGWSPLGWTGWISLQSKGLSGVFSNTTVQKHQFFGTQPSSQSNFHIHTWPQEKPQPWLDGHYFVGKVVSLLFNMLSRLVITFLPKSKRLLISWLQSPSAVILESCCFRNHGSDCMLCWFWMQVEFDPMNMPVLILWFAFMLHVCGCWNPDLSVLCSRVKCVEGHWSQTRRSCS